MHVKTSARGRRSGRAKSGWLEASSGSGAARARVAEPLDDRFLLAKTMALDLDETARAAEDRRETGQDLPGAVDVTGREAQRDRPTRAPGETHEPGGVRLEVVERERGGPLGGAELHPGDHAAKVLVALAIFHEQRQARAVGQRDLAADDRLHARVRGRAGQPRRAVDAVAIDHGQRGHLESRRLGGERLGVLGAFEEREGRLGVELDEHGQS